jgi:hypothetical protein
VTTQSGTDFIATRNRNYCVDCDQSEEKLLHKIKDWELRFPVLMIAAMLNSLLVNVKKNWQPEREILAVMYQSGNSKDAVEVVGCDK